MNEHMNGAEHGVSAAESHGPLAGIRVLEVGGGVSGPFAAKLLADYGADVLKVEPPKGDHARRHGPFPDDTPHPERSALFLYLNTNKRGIVLDLEQPDGRATFRRLAADADVLIENLPPGTLTGWGLSHATLATDNPRLVTVSLTPFGQDGPYAGHAATNLTVFATGGQMAMTGDPDREPLKNAGYQAEYQLGLNGFSAAAIALVGARAGGRGQHVDVSAQECMVSVLEGSLNTHAYTGRFLGSRRGNTMSAAIAIYECADGYLGVHAMPRNLPFLLDLMGLSELLEDERFRTPAARLEHNDDLLAVFMGWAAGQHKRDVYERAGHQRAPVAYVHGLQDLRESPQLAARGYWTEIDHPETGPLVYPGAPFRMSDSPWRGGRSPLLGEHGMGDGEWLSELGDAHAPSAPVGPSTGAAASPLTPPDRSASPRPITQHPSPNTDPSGRRASMSGDARLPLASVRVLDLTMVWAGPYGTRILGDMGAEVIKIEAINFYDQLRNLGFLPPGTDAAWNKAAYFNHNNRDKLGCTLDLASESGRTLFLELVKTADVVVENYRAEVMDRLKLDYAALRAVKPDVILVSMPGHGKSGPEKDYVAYGTNIEQLAGLVSLSGYLGGGPQKTGISYGDPMSGVAMAGAVAAAIMHRDRTGRGQYVELAQRELLMSVIGEYLVAYSMNGRQPPPLGNRHPFHAPHGVYPCTLDPTSLPPAPVIPGQAAREGVDGDAPPITGEGWVAIACADDAQFAALCEVMGRPELARDGRFAGERVRYLNQDELDAIIAAWTAERDKDDIVALLQAKGVPSAPVLSVPEVLHDPHLRARGFFERVTHADAGTWDMEGPVYRLSASPAHIRINAPRFGEHNAYVLGHLLGRAYSELQDLERLDVIGTRPNMAVHQ